MKFKGILLDLDNTLYDYEQCHRAALDQSLDELSNHVSLERPSLEDAFFKARDEIHAELSSTAAMHNRLLYFQRMLENLNQNSLEHSLRAYQTYWDVYVSRIKLFDGVRDFFQINKDTKIGIVTDLTADVQHKKLGALDLVKEIDCLVTSEEARAEKPDPKIFTLTLKKLKLDVADVCMIGDNFKKDIMGATDLNIQSFWLNRDRQQQKLNALMTEIKSFDEILKYFS